MAISKTPMQKGVKEDADLENRPIYLWGGGGDGMGRGEGERERERGGGSGGGDEMSKQLRNKSLIWAVLALKSK
jgi:hypothetical protein